MPCRAVHASGYADLPVEAICAEPRNHIRIEVCGAAGLVKLGHAERIRRGLVPA